MKCSEYLWKRVELDTVTGDDWSSDRVGGEMLKILNGEPIVSDLDGAVINEAEALSIYGRNVKRLNAAFKAGRKSLFRLICTNQQVTDEEFRSALQTGNKE